MSIICVYNYKGGTLKTTTTTNLAGVLATNKKKVLIIDGDSQSNVAVTFGKNPDEFKYSLYDVLIDGINPKDALVKVHKYIDVLPSNDDLISFDFEVIGSSFKYKNPFALIKNTVEMLVPHYDYILIDTPPSMSLMVGNAFTFADKVLIPYSPETYNMRSLVKVIETIKEFKEQHNPKLSLLGVLPTLVDYRTTLHSQIMEDTRKYCVNNDIKMFFTYIPRSIRFANAVAYDQLPATLVKKKNNDIAQAYFDLWKEISEGDI